MTTTLRPELGVLPTRLRKLPLDARGYPVPWFVAWIDGPEGPETVPEFRAMDRRKFVQAIKEKRCWVCGEKLGTWLAFPIGPMCAITRTTGEPPCHRECAEWSIQHCPFLSNPQTVRRDTDLPANMDGQAGFGLTRNPGVTCLWVTRSYETWNDREADKNLQGKTLITVGRPEMVTWWCEGREATRAEVEESVSSGMPALLGLAKAEGPFAVQELGKQLQRAEELFP